MRKIIIVIVMRVYLKSGRKIRVSQDTANEIVNMMISGDDNLLVQRNRFTGSVQFAIHIDEVAAIKD